MKTKIRQRKNKKRRNVKKGNHAMAAHSIHPPNSVPDDSTIPPLLPPVSPVALLPAVELAPRYASTTEGFRSVGGNSFFTFDGSSENSISFWYKASDSWYFYRMNQVDFNSFIIGSDAYFTTRFYPTQANPAFQIKEKSSKLAVGVYNYNFLIDPLLEWLEKEDPTSHKIYLALVKAHYICGG